MMTQSSGYTGTGLAAVLAGAVLAVSTAWGSVIFQDDFDGTAIDDAVWERVSSYNNGIYGISDGYLRLAMRGASLHCRLISWRDDFNFFAEPLTIEWIVDPERTLVQPVGYYKSWMPNAGFAVFITDGSDTVAISLVAAYRSSEGVIEEYYTLAGSEIDAVPERLVWTLDGQSWTLTVEGAEFVSAPATERSGTYTKQESDFSEFRLTIQVRGAENYTANAYVDSIIVRGPPPPRGTLLTVF